MKPDNAHEKRTHGRVSFHCPLGIFTPKGMLFGEAVNISMSGMMIKVNELPEQDDSIWLIFKFPSSKRVHTVKGAVMWVSSPEERVMESHFMGLRFIDLEKEIEKQLIHLTL